MPVYQQYEDVGSDGIIDMPSGASIGGHCNALFGVTGLLTPTTTSPSTLGGQDGAKDTPNSVAASV